MTIRIILAALAVACVTQPASAQPASGGPVDPAVIENLVAAGRILASAQSRRHW